ncbi:MAG: class I SAM-dependent methyltransferase [Asgard group archaeon]|nr:class I SAM-dependent methyltransferase [Asgard group archaeon]
MPSEKNFSSENEDELSEDYLIPYTSRLMAYYRSLEMKKTTPLINDPYAERLAGDMSDYISQHPHFSRMDYPIVRAAYVEEQLLIPWLTNYPAGQIILLGAGLDTKVYRLEVLQKSHTFFEIDLPKVIRYKEIVLKEATPNCKLYHIASDLGSKNWFRKLLQTGFSQNKPTFWSIEGLAYYLKKKTFESIMEKISSLNSSNNELFVDLCIPAYAELNFGTFTKNFQWGIKIADIHAYFEKFNWDIECNYADTFDQGRDVGQRGLIFVHAFRESK